jgi:hypothetical protein
MFKVCFFLFFLSSIIESFLVLNIGKTKVNNVKMAMQFSPNRLKKIVGVSLLSFLISDMKPSWDISQLQLIKPVQAEFRAAQKRTFFRFVPRLVVGRDFFANDLKTAIDKEDWNTVSKFFETYISKRNKNDPDQIDATDTFVNSNLFRPMKVLSGSFAERAASPKQRLLTEHLEAFQSAMIELEGFSHYFF